MPFYALIRIINLMRILSKYDLFIFDWDHTLTNSTLMLDILYLLNVGRKKRRALKRMEEDKPENAIKHIKIKEDVNRIYALFDDMYSLMFRPKLKKDAIEFLAFLKKNHKKIAIFSDSKTYRLMKETRELDVLKYVDYALSAESIDRYKPDPTGLLVLIDRFNATKVRTLYVGDMTSDILAAKFAKVDSCAVSDGIDLHAQLADARPTYCFKTLREFLNAVEKK
jgi:phosphoglycolate phosphatase-like HAD superfamily hydrolase